MTTDTTPARGTRPHRRLPAVRASAGRMSAGGTFARCRPRARYTTEAIVLSPLRPGRGGPRPDAAHARRRQAQGDRQGRPPADSRASAAASSRSPSCTVVLARGRTFDVVTQASVGHAWLTAARPARESAATAWYLAELADRSVEERARGRAALRAAAPRLPAARRRDGARARRALVRDGPARRARRAARGRALRRVRPRCSRRTSGSAGCRCSAASLCQRCPGPPHDRTGAVARRAQAARRTGGSTSRPSPSCASRRRVEAEVEAALREFVRHALEREARSLAFLDEVRHARRSAQLMATVQLRDIVTDADRGGPRAAPRRPARNGSSARWSATSRTPIAEPQAMPADVVGPRRRPARRLRDDQRRHPGETLAADDDIVGPYYLWRLLDRRAVPGPRLRRGDHRRGRRLPADPARTPTSCWTSCERGEGSPQPFYEHYGFVDTGEIMWDEDAPPPRPADHGGAMTRRSIPPTPRAPDALERLAHRADRLADDDRPGRPAAELADLVPVEGRRDPGLLGQARAAERQHRRPPAGGVQPQHRRRWRRRRRRWRAPPGSTPTARPPRRTRPTSRSTGPARRVRLDAPSTSRASTRSWSASPRRAGGSG